MAFLQKLDAELNNFGTEADLIIKEIIRTGKTIHHKSQLIC